MSRTTAEAGWPRPLAQALLQELIDDAAVFPPRSATLDAAVAGYGEHRRGPLAPFLGPLLVPASAATNLLRVLDSGPGAAHPPAVQLINRPGQDPHLLSQARQVLAGRVDVVGIELGHSPDWREVAGADAVAVEVSRGPAGSEALADLGRAAGDPRVRAKLRTQSTSAEPVPTAGELAAFISTCQQLDLGFKLTGGLHHAVAGPAATPGGSEDQHGVLNVLVATHLAHAGADVDTIAVALRERDADILVGVLLGLRADQAERLRTSFTSFGCCDVGDPLQDLAGRGLLPATWPGTDQEPRPANPT